MGTWHDPDLGRPIVAPLPRGAELLGVDLATITEAAGSIEPYLRADGTRVWSLMQLERSCGHRPMAGGEAATSIVDEPAPPTHNQHNREPPRRAGTRPHPAPPHLDEKPSPAMLMHDLPLVPEGSAHARDHP